MSQSGQPEEYTLQIEYLDDLAVINVLGRLRRTPADQALGDLRENPPADKYAKAMSEVFDKGIRRVVIDLSAANHMDVTAVVELAVAFVAATRGGAKVVSVAPGLKQITEDLMVDLPEVYDSREEALDALRQDD